ncbi:MULTISPECIES: PilN domain-containing protein [unclassified Cupriavidus]|uniref:PilN domain-containing protein n=1 Tax=Cupriavidus sp. H19C3 TaxID=3241603 RepID=UPI003BF77411
MTRAQPLPPQVAFDVNLLPYRDEHRHARRRRALSSLGLAAGIAAVAVAGTGAIIARADDELGRLNALLSAEVNAMDARLGEIHSLEGEVRALNERQQAIAVLQLERVRAPRLLEQLGQLVPSNLYLATLHQAEAVVTVTGVASSNSDISALLLAMNRAPWIRDAQLVESRTLAATEGVTARQALFGFSVTFTDGGAPLAAAPGGGAVPAAALGPSTPSTSSVPPTPPTPPARLNARTTPESS